MNNRVVDGDAFWKDGIVDDNVDDVDFDVDNVVDDDGDDDDDNDDDDVVEEEDDF